MRRLGAEVDHAPVALIATMLTRLQTKRQTKQRMLGKARPDWPDKTSKKPADPFKLTIRGLEDTRTPNKGGPAHPQQ